MDNFFPKEHLKQFSDQLEGKHPREILAWVNTTFPTDEVGMATGFGAEGVALIDMLASVNRNIPVFFLDTDVLFDETYRLRAQLEEMYSIQIIRHAPALTLDDQAALHGPRLWEREPDLCCNIRKVEPLREALQIYSGWITAIRRDQSAFRATAGIVEWDSKFNLIKVNPLAGWTKKDVWNHITEHKVPYNPLYDKGYSSIGCTHCTTTVAVGEHERAGRWRGFQKTECGLHRPDTPAAGGERGRSA